MANQNYFKNQSVDFIDIDKSDIPINTAYGVYVGVVKAIDTEFRMGRLYVYIPGFSSGDPKQPFSLPQVTYASPFLSSTTGELSSNPGLFTVTGQTYGMNFPLPDIDSQVLCCFPAGQRQYGYWFACITNRLSRNMVPDIGAISGKLLMPESIPVELEKLIDSSQNYPVGEINEENKNNFKQDWYSVDQRPLHIPRITQLWNQGLDADPARGVITSSSQREPISSVYGFITPGRPVNDPGKDPTILAGLKNRDINETYAQKFKTKARLGGHSFVLDDGDFTGKNNLVRLRSSAGHQIILNDAEGFIYVSTASGNNWIELTNSGDLLIYNQGDMAVRSQGDILFHSDQKINLNAKQINFRAQEDINIQSPFFNLNANSRANLYSGYLNLQGRAAQLSAANSVSIKSGSTINIAGSTILLNSDSAAPNVNIPKSIPKFQYKDVVGVRYPVSAETAQFTPGNVPFVNLWTQEPVASLISINTKVPTHEPYDRTGLGSRIGALTNVSIQQNLVNLSSLTGNANDLASVTSTYPGVANAVRQPINQAKKAPASSFVSQPVPAENVGNLNRDQTQAYMAQIGYSESSGRYDINNNLGYQGKYQLGSAALQDLGYVKPGTPQTQEALSNPNNWIGGAGKPANLDEFLKNPGIQEQAMQEYTNKNYKSLENLGLVNENTSPEVVSGYLSAAHLGGPKGVERWAKGGLDAADANGTTLSSYFQLGRYSQTQTPIIAASNASRAT